MIEFEDMTTILACETRNGATLQERFNDLYVGYSHEHEILVTRRLWGRCDKAEFGDSEVKENRYPMIQEKVGDFDSFAPVVLKACELAIAAYKVSLRAEYSISTFEVLCATGSDDPLYTEIVNLSDDPHKTFYSSLPTNQKLFSWADQMSMGLVFGLEKDARSVIATLHDLPNTVTCSFKQLLDEGRET